MIPLQVFSILTQEGHSPQPDWIVNLHQDHKLAFSPNIAPSIVHKNGCLEVLWLQITENMVHIFRRTLRTFTINVSPALTFLVEHPLNILHQPNYVVVQLQGDASSLLVLFQLMKQTGSLLLKTSTFTAT